MVTGGAGFLGRHFCLGLSQVGATVVVSDIDYAVVKNVCQKLAEKTKNLLFPAEVDLADEQSVKKWAGLIRADFGGADVLLNNAAAHLDGFFDPLEEFKIEVWNRVMAVNVTGIFLTVRELGPSMISKGGGSIINVSSIIWNSRAGSTDL